MGSITANTGLPGDIGERTVAVVVVQHVLAPVGDEQVFKPVVVIVAHADTGRPTHAVQAGFFRHIGEGAIAVVLVESVGGAFWSPLESRPAEDENVEPAVIVIVE